MSSIAIAVDGMSASAGRSTDADQDASSRIAADSGTVTIVGMSSNSNECLRASVGECLEKSWKWL